MRSPIETKVAGPAIITGLLGAGGGALYAVLLAYDHISPDAEQSAALAGLGAFTLYAVQTVTAYLLPHTPRTDEAAERPRRRMHRRGATASDGPPSRGRGYEGEGPEPADAPGSERLA